MEIWDQQRYVLLAGQHLDRFVAKPGGVYNFRCPFCHDSKKSKTKSRGYLYPDKDKYYFKCQNCGRPNTLGNFLKDLDHSLYKEYVFDMMSSKKSPKKFEESETKPSLMVPDPLKPLKRLDQLGPMHKAVRYITGRKIPSVWLSRLYYCENFSSWGNDMLPGKLDEDIIEDRIIIPVFDEKRNFIGCQGRSLAPKEANKLRYITLALDKTKPQIFNLENLNRSKPFYIFEGPFDAMFIPNSIALTGATKAFDGKNGIFVLDNEPRNKDIVRQYGKLVKDRETVFFWPTISDKKEDVNDLILRGMLPTDVKKMIDENSFSGIEAEFKLAKWKRV